MRQKLFFSAILLLVSLFSSARTDELSRQYLTAERIVWKQGDIRLPEILLTSNSGQSVLGNTDCCILKSTPGETASILLDYGREMHGGLQLITGQFASGKPVRVRIRFGESVSEAMSDVSDETGATNDHAVRDFVTELPWLGVREFGNTGFRFVRIDLLDENVELTLKEATAIWVFRDIPYLGSFKSDDIRLNEIWRTGAYTVHQNMQGYIWDGIKRDRLVWIGDMHPEAMTIHSVFGDQEVLRRSLDYAREATPLPNMMSGMNAYSLWWIIIQRDLYLYQGNMDFLKAQEEYLCGLVDVVAGKVGKDGRDTFGDHFLDWPSRADENASAAGFHALFILAMEAGETLCRELGAEASMRKCIEVASSLRKAAPGIVKAFFEEKIAPDAPGRKQAVALMCLADLIPEQKAAADLLVNGASGFSTFYGYYMLEALAKCGKYDEAMQIIRDFWGGMLDLGATTFWEDFDIRWLQNAARIDEITPEGKVDVHLTYGGYCYKQLRHSLCHGWASGPTAWLTRHVLGLYPLTPGSRSIMIDPDMGALEHIEGALPTPFGVVSVILDRQADGRVKAVATIPDGVSLKASEKVELIIR